MASPTTENLSAVKTRLRASFLAQLPPRIEQCRNSLARLSSGAEGQEELQRLHLLFHTIKGSGASFGFAVIAEIAQHGEMVLREILDHHQPVTDELLGVLHQQLQTLEAAQAQDASPGLTEEPNFALPMHIEQAAIDRDQRFVYLCDDDPDQVNQLASQLGCFGYRIVPFTALSDLRQALQGHPLPAAIIMDIMFPEGATAGADLLLELRGQFKQPLPTIFMSSRNDFQMRLNSVKAGGNAFCPKPVNAAEMVESLDYLTNRTPPEPFNILIVDDDPDISRLHASILESAGMTCQVVNVPEQVLEVLEHFRADLVLMDLYMPHCSGLELASLLRQIPGFVSLPIIYVSSETNEARQFKALEVGADGFLVKPISSGRMIEEVRLRAERMRTLRSLMIRDSLTGLFNHNTILQFLELAVAAARRNQCSLCFAMIDVDFFKKVNDQYGHAAGDQVLMALSRTLRLRLRESDLVGRYGGEEFAVVLTDSTLQGAKEMLEQLRLDFSRVQFYAEGQEFHCTFSAGIAEFPTCADSRQLAEVADRALYRAKHEGRNRVALMCVENQEPLTNPSS